MRDIEPLAHAARQEKIPAFDVTTAVMDRIRRVERPGGPNTVLAVMAGLSAVAAVVVVAVALNVWWTWQEPVTELLYAANVVTP